jgi:hypothetical protein
VTEDCKIFVIGRLLRAGCWRWFCSGIVAFNFDRAFVVDRCLIASSIVAFGFDRIDGRSCVLIKQRVVICRSRDTFSVIKWTID